MNVAVPESPEMLTWPGNAIVQLSVCLSFYLSVFISNLYFFIPVSLPKRSHSSGSSFKNSNSNITYLKNNNLSLHAKKHQTKQNQKQSRRNIILMELDRLNFTISLSFWILSEFCLISILHNET